MRADLLIRLHHKNCRFHSVHLHIRLRTCPRSLTASGDRAAGSGCLLKPFQSKLPVCSQVEVACDEVQNNCSRNAYQQHCNTGIKQLRARTG